MLSFDRSGLQTNVRRLVNIGLIVRLTIDFLIIVHSSNARNSR